MERIAVARLQDTASIETLKEFRKLLRSCIGKNGSLKIFITGGCYQRLSSSSSHLCEFLSPLTNNVQLKFIMSVMTSRPDFSLYTGILTAYLTEMLNFSSRLQSVICGLFDCATRILDPGMSRLTICLRFDSISELKTVVKNVVQSKPRCSLYSAHSVDELSSSVVKAFLHTMDVQTGTFGKVRVDCIRSTASTPSISVFPGVVYRLAEFDDDWIIRLVNSTLAPKVQIKVLLFTLSLNWEAEGDLEAEKARGLLSKAVSLGVDLVACQKTVHSEVITYLRRNSVVLLERMGTELARDFQAISGAFPISSVAAAVQADRLDGMVGTLATVRIHIAGANQFLQLSGRDVKGGGGGLATILLTTTLHTDQQLKVVIEQALDSLQAITKSPYLSYGGGCMEVQLWLLIMQELGVELSQVGDGSGLWLLSALIEAATGTSALDWTSNWRVDTALAHCWRGGDDEHACNCGLARRDEVLRRSGGWLPLTSPSARHLHLTEIENPPLIDEDCLVDCFALKRSAILSALQSSTYLASVGAVVSRPQC